MMPSPAFVEQIDPDGRHLPDTLAALYALSVRLAAEAEPGDILHGATPEELLTAVQRVGTILPRFQWPFVVGERITVGSQ